MICELSITNADKGAINEQNIINRINQFRDKKLDLVITTVGLFFDKAEFIRNSSFVIGYDTYIRVINKKYYNNDIMQMLDKFKYQSE